MNSQKHSSVKGTVLPLFLGSTKDQQINSLQSIKDAMVDILITNSAEDCAFNESTIEFVNNVYLKADVMVHQLKNNKYVD